MNTVTYEGVRTPTATIGEFCESQFKKFLRPVHGRPDGNSASRSHPRDRKPCASFGID